MCRRDSTITGLIYEGKVDLATFIAEQKNYAVEGNDAVSYTHLVHGIFLEAHEGRIGISLGVTVSLAQYIQ